MGVYGCVLVGWLVVVGGWLVGLGGGWLHEMYSRYGRSGFDCSGDGCRCRCRHPPLVAARDVSS